MKKFNKITLFLILGAAVAGFLSFRPAGKIYVTHTGHIWFFSQTAMENIEAHNYQAGAKLDASTGEMAYSVLVKGFEFKKDLMQTHFNENYMESDKYPRSTFKGKITDISSVNFDKNGTYNVKVNGDINLHNVTKNITVDGTITVKNDSVYAKSTFPVALKDYNIEVPSVVRDKIAKTINVHVDMVFPKN